jgi:YVTN family beta-propeller protein
MAESGRSSGHGPAGHEGGQHVTIQVGRTPHSVAISHDGSRVYVTHFLTGSVSVIDTVDNSVTATFALSPGLYGVAVSSDDAFIYVANQDSGFVHRIDAINGAKGISAGIGAKPYGLASSPQGKLYAACPLDDAIEVLDASVKNVARIRDADFSVALATSPEGSRLYASNYFSATVSVIDLAGVNADISSHRANVEAKISVKNAPYGLAVSSDGSRLFVAHFQSEDLVSIIDTSSLQLIEELHVGNGPVRGVAVAPDNSRLYVTNYFSESISVILL